MLRVELVVRQIYALQKSEQTLNWRRSKRVGCREDHLNSVQTQEAHDALRMMEACVVEHQYPLVAPFRVKVVEHLEKVKEEANGRFLVVYCCVHRVEDLASAGDAGCY